MKARLLKIVPLFLIAALVAGGVLAGVPGGAEAARKTIYNVEILDTDTLWTLTDPAANNESPAVWVLSINKEAPASPGSVITANEGITFQLGVKHKAKTKKVRIGKEKVKTTYYPVTIKKKTFKAPIAEYLGTDPIEGRDWEVEIVTDMAKSAKGKLYISDTDVDVSHVQGKKKSKTKIGDGTVDPPGSLIIDIELVVSHRARGVIIIKERLRTTWTTGTSSIVVNKSKSGLEGMAFPEDDPSGVLPTPLVGVPLDLEAGTGTLVATSGTMRSRISLGRWDILRGQVWKMKITNPGYGSVAVTPSNPGYGSVVVTPSQVLPPVLYSIEIDPESALIPLGSSDMATVVVENLIEEPLVNDGVTVVQNGDLTGNVTVTADVYAPAPSGGISTYPTLTAVPVIAFPGLTVHPGRTITLLVPIVPTAATLPGSLFVFQAVFTITAGP
jgi:hypothetical protein